MARRRPNGRRVKRHRSYTVDEAARLLRVAKGTVRRWLKDGLPAITDQKPLLILGGDLSDYLDASAKPKQTCRLDECFCLSCRAPRKAAFGEAEFMPLSVSSGNLRALCEMCATIMYKRVSMARLDDLRRILDVTIMQGSEPISKPTEPCLNDHLPMEDAPHA